MPYIVHCLRRGRAKLSGNVRTVESADAAERIRLDWLALGAEEVDIRPVDDSRDWNNTADPAVQAAIREERAEIEGRA